MGLKSSHIIDLWSPPSQIASDRHSTSQIISIMVHFRLSCFNISTFSVYLSDYLHLSSVHIMSPSVISALFHLISCLSQVTSCPGCFSMILHHLSSPPVQDTKLFVVNEQLMSHRFGLSRSIYFTRIVKLMNNAYP